MKEEESIGVDGHKNVVLEFGDEAALDQRLFFCYLETAKYKFFFLNSKGVKPTL